MDNISEFSAFALNEPSLYVKPLRLKYCQNGKQLYWDMIRGHSSVCIVIFNTTRKVLVLVKQFRAAVYYTQLLKKQPNFDLLPLEKGNEPLIISPGSDGLTLELCAGIIDKNISTAEIAKSEVLEECGYDVPLDKFEHVQTILTSVGTIGDTMTLFYVEVTDEMKVTLGGGCRDEGEFIEVVDLSLEEAKNILSNKTIQSPVSLLYGLMWFFTNKYM